MPDLSDRDEERFAELRERLEGVTRHDPEREPDRLDTAPGAIDPMLARTFDGDLAALESDQWVAEQKLDGTRIILEKFDGEVTVYTRRHVERSDTLPELCEVASNTLPDGVVLDGEYTFLDERGDSQFVPIHSSDERIESGELTPQYFVFDVLAVEHEWCTREPLEERKSILDDLLPTDAFLKTVEVEEEDIPGFYDDIVARGEEGIILKRRGSTYHVDTRSDNWRKVKATKEADFAAVGYTPGEGKRSETFGALVLTDGKQYVGRVGSGFSEAELDSLIEQMEPVEDRPVPVSAVASDYTPVEPFVVQVEYLEISDDGKLRAPVFVRRKPENPIDDVQPL